MLMASSRNEEISEIKEILKGEFEMKCHGEAKRILYMNIMKNHERSEICLSQSSYLKKEIK